MGLLVQIKLQTRLHYIVTQAGSFVLEEQKGRVKTPVRRLFADFGRENPLLLAVTVAASVAAPLLSLVPPYVIKIVVDSVLRESGQFGVPVIGRFASTTGQWDRAVVAVSLIITSAVLL